VKPLSSNTKVSLVVVAVVVAVVGAVVLFSQIGRPAPPAEAERGGAPPTAPADVLVRQDSHLLSPAGGEVTVVEFLDLECEACGAAYPVVERLRAEYGDRVTFVLRYFPVPSHQNAELAARAVEAAGRQGQLEAMYRTMYETQPGWGDQQVSHRATFVGFARDLGLDVAAFEEALDDPATIERVLADRQDGIDLGVRGTPTFFVDGVRFDRPATYEGLRSAIERELTR